VLLPYDIDAYFYVDNGMSNIFCIDCGNRLDRDVRPKFLKLGNKFDIGSTYDGELLLSERSKLVFSSISTSLNFETYPTNKGVYSRPCDLGFVRIDADFRPIEFSGKCDLCGGYKEIGPVGPAKLICDEDLGDFDILQSDLEAGFGNRKHRLIMIGMAAFSRMRQKKLSGLFSGPVYYSSLSRWWK